MKKKWGLRLLFIFLTLWLTILLAIYILTNNYKDFAISYLKDYLDKQLATEIIVKKSDIHFSLFRKFPHITIWMDNILVKSAPGPDYRQINLIGKDTLLFAEKVSFVFNLQSLFTKHYELIKIEINDAELNILLDKEKRGNYLIFKNLPGETSQDSFLIDLQKIDIKNIHFCYYDASSKILLTSLIKNGTISGIISDNDLTFSTSIKCLNTNLKIKDKEYLNNESILLGSSILSKQDNYYFKKGKLVIFGIEVGINGEWLGKKNIYKLTIKAKNELLQNIRNKQLESYFNKFGFRPVKGNLNFTLDIASKNNGIPHIKADYLISKATFENTSNEIKLKDFYLKGKYSNGSASDALSSIVIIDSLSTLSDQSQLVLSGSLKNFNAPCISGKIYGTIELEKICKLNGVQSRLDLSGIINTSISFSGVLPAFNSFKIASLKNLTFKSKIDFENIYIKPLSNPFPAVKATGNISFSNINEIFLEKISLTAGQSIFIVTGTVSNIPLFVDGNNSILTYKCKVNSPEFHVEDFLVRNTDARKIESAKKAEFPDSIIINTIFRAEKFSFGKFTATDVRGGINYRNNTLKIDSFSMNSQDGKLYSNIDIKWKENYFITHCEATLKQINIRSLFESFNNFGQTVIGSENLGGKISGNLIVFETWDKSLNPQKEQLILQGDYEIIDGEIINYQPLLGLSRFIDLEELKHIRFKRLQSTISIRQRTVYFSQTDIKSSAMNLTGSGEHRFDNSYEYHFQVQLSDVLWAKAKKKKPQNDEFGYIVEDGLNRTSLPLVIKGKGTDYDVSYDRKAAIGTFKEKVNKEKYELKLLLNSAADSIKINVPEEEQKIEWEEDDHKKTNKNSDKTSKDLKNKEEFSIKWEDE